MENKTIYGIIAIILIVIASVILIAAVNNNSDSNRSVLTLVSDDDSDDDLEDDQDDAEEEDIPITGTALERASAVALAYIGEGRVTDTEIGDEEGYYEIEITLDNGDEVDVHLDKDFNVLSVEYD